MQFDFWELLCVLQDSFGQVLFTCRFVIVLVGSVLQASVKFFFIFFSRVCELFVLLSLLNALVDFSSV